jgi:competence protein ComEC
VTGETSPDRKVLIYDGGHWDDDQIIIDELTHYLKRRKTVDHLIVSHSDSDHLGAADSILSYWNVRKSYRTGWERTGVATYSAYIDALEQSVRDKGTADIVMDSGDIALGETWNVGAAQVQLLSGIRELPEGWDVGVPPSHSRYESKALNAVSIVVRIDYAGRSILLTGDAVGRLDEAPDDQILATEKFLVENAATRSLKADIITAPHHGADNASSTPFIEAVQPTWVIFSAGNHHKHPKFKTYQRYQAAGVSEANMLRTDRGDEKGRDTEWWGDWDDSCRDRHGDDGISIIISANTGAVAIEQDAPLDVSLGC